MKKTLLWIGATLLILGSVGGFVSRSYIAATCMLALGVALIPNLNTKINRKARPLVIVGLVLAIFITIPLGAKQQSPNTQNTSQSNKTYASASIKLSNTNSVAASSASDKTNVQNPLPVKTANTDSKIQISGDLKIHFIDVGQADSIFIELPTNPKTTMLIDAGNIEDGDNIVKYIKDLGYSSVDYIVGTHPHEDHIGGLPTVLSGLTVKSIYMPKVSNNTEIFKKLLQTIKDKGLKVDTAKAGVQIIAQDNLNIKIIAPVEDAYDDLNNCSAVVKITYKKISALFMGDAEELSESQIVDNVKADILKVGHHGSNSSSSKSFICKVQPKYAIISCGKNNSYGHPSQTTLDTLTTIGSDIYRTDIDGTIVATSDGDKVSIQKAETNPINANAPPTSNADKPTIEKSEASSPTIPSINTSKPEEKEITVYVTKTGEKYHTSGCSYLRKSKISISLDDAIASGYTPCSRCHPPTK